MSSTSSIQALSLLFLIFASEILSIQFGFSIKETGNETQERFVVFGLIPESTSSKVKSEIVDSLNAYVSEELHRRRFEGVERESFLVEPAILAASIEGKSFVGLKGELSVFLNIFRFSCKKIQPVQSTWKEASFLSEPILALSFDEIGKFTREFEVNLIRPAFLEEPDSHYDDFIRFDSVSSFDYDEVITFHHSRSERNPLLASDSSKCCCCNIS